MPGCPAALPALGRSASAPGETEARRPQLHRSPSLSRGGKRSPRRGRDDTSSPSSSRSTLFLQEPGSPGSGRAARASLLPAPPALPAPALAPRPCPVHAGTHTFPPRVRATLERCRGRSVPNFPAMPTAQPGVTDRQEGGFFSPFIYSLGAFFPFLETKAGCVPRRRVRGGPAVPGPSGEAGPAAPGALGGRFPLHTDGCFDSVERLT